MQTDGAGPYAGLKIGYLPRNSDPQQDGNYSQRRQHRSMAEHIRAGGGMPVPFDEGIISGRDLARRPAALQALDAIERGDLQGLAWEQIDRMTRDEYGADAAVIAKTLHKKRAILVTRERDYRLWKTSDLKAYRAAAADAGLDLLTIRDRLWGGIMEKAADEPFFMGIPPYGYSTELVDELADTATRRHRIKRRPIRDEACAEVMAAVAQALNYATCLGEAAARLNSQGHFRTMAKGPTAGQPAEWATYDLRAILDKPIYEGWWTLGRRSDGTSSIWDTAPTGDGRGGKLPALYRPALAWFDSSQLEAWRIKYPVKDAGTGPRHRKAPHPLRDILFCSSCDRAMVGWQPGLYACCLKASMAMDRLCEAPQMLSERAAVRVLIAEVPNALRAVDELEQEMIGQAVDDDELDALRRRREMREAQTDALMATAYPDDWDGTPNPAITRKLEQWKQEISELSDEIRKRTTVARSDPDRRALVQAILAEPEKFVSKLPEPELWAFLRNLYGHVVIRATGWGGGRRFELVSYRNLWLDSGVARDSAGTGALYQTIRSYLEWAK